MIDENSINRIIEQAVTLEVAEPKPVSPDKKIWSKTGHRANRQRLGT